MEEQAHLLDEFAEKQPQKGKYFRGFVAASSCFISFLVLEFIVDLEHFSLKSIEWDIGLAILALPVIGLFFISIGKKIGWVFSLLYYIFFCVLVLLTMIEDY